MYKFILYIVHFRFKKKSDPSKTKTFHYDHFLRSTMSFKNLIKKEFQ